MYAPEQGHGESRRGGFEAAPPSDVMHDLTGLLSHWALGLSAIDKKHSKTDVRMRGGSALTPETEFEEDVAHRTSNVEPETETETETPQSLSGSGGLPAMCSAAAGERREGAKQTGAAPVRVRVRVRATDLLYFIIPSECSLSGHSGRGTGTAAWRGFEAVRIMKNEQIRGDTAAAQLATSVERDRTLS